MSYDVPQSGMINLTVIDRPAETDETFDDKPAKHHGDRRVRVKNETRALKPPVLFPSISRPTLPAEESTQANEKGPGEEKKQVDADPQPMDWRPLIDRSLNPEDDDLKVGGFAVVNMDQHKYYSFFSRMYNQVYPEWNASLRKLIFEQMTVTDVIRDLVNKKRITEVEFWLLPDGKVHSAHVMKESGVQVLDDRHMDAFLKIAIFPNPPKDMMTEDGFIKIRIVFEVSMKPDAIARSSDGSVN